MTEQIVITGADPRLNSEFEVGRSETLLFRAPFDSQCVALFGPHIDLPAGHYRFELDFEVQERTPGRVVVELCNKFARKKFYVRPCLAWELDEGRIRISFGFGDAVTGLELRLIVPPGFAGAVKSLRISPLSVPAS
jgi:hypothetical protein